MALGDELAEHVTDVLAGQWQPRRGLVVPDSPNVKLMADAVHFAQATVLYADLADSTKLVDSYKWHYAAEVYQTFLYCSARLITQEGGVITAYDGDRVMGVFLDDAKNTRAARCALKINYCVKEIIGPRLTAQYPNSGYQMRHVVGIDTSEIHVARTGVRGSNDLVWVGRAANYAAKLAALSDEYPTWITRDVYAELSQPLLATNGQSMWQPMTWTAMNSLSIYRSNWRWRVE